MVMKVVVSDDSKIVLYPWQLVLGMKLSCMRCSFSLMYRTGCVACIPMVFPRLHFLQYNEILFSFQRTHKWLFSIDQSTRIYGFFMCPL